MSYVTKHQINVSSLTLVKISTYHPPKADKHKSPTNPAIDMQTDTESITSNLASQEDI